MTEHDDEGLEIDPEESNDPTSNEADEEDNPEDNLVDEDVVEGRGAA
jgi:hypothetical protein